MVSLLKRTAVAVLALGSVAMAEVKLQGAGATFPNPIYQRWITEFVKANPEVKVDYQSIGSGGGIKGITEKTVDFAGSDAPMNKKELEAAGAEVVHIPTVAGAVVAAYNVPGVAGDLKLTGEILVDIYTGKISKWDDEKIKAENAGVALPPLPITPVYRSDGSGTTFVYSSYLAAVSEEFKSSVGPGKQVKWPIGQGAKGNEGVTAAVSSTPGAIGYIEVNYAIANKINFALLKNKAGKFIKAGPDSISAAGAGALDQMSGGKLAVNIWNTSGEEAYPISAFTYIIVFKDLKYVKDEAKAKELVKFITWATHDGQSLAKEMDYAPLADGVKAKVAEAIASLTFDGKPLK